MNFKNKLNILIVIAGVTISSFCFSDETITCCGQCITQPGCVTNDAYTAYSGCNIAGNVECLYAYTTDSDNCTGYQPCNYS